MGEDSISFYIFVSSNDPYTSVVRMTFDEHFIYFKYENHLYTYVFFENMFLIHSFQRNNCFRLAFPQWKEKLLCRALFIKIGHLLRFCNAKKYKNSSRSKEAVSLDSLT